MPPKNLVESEESVTYEEIELNDTYAIISIPEDAVEITIQCKVYADGKLMEVSRTLSMKEIREAMEEYKVAEECGYIPPDAVFTLTEKGMDYAAWLEGNE